MIEWGVRIDKGLDEPVYMPFLAKRWAEVWIATFGDKYTGTLVCRDITPWREV